MKPFGRLRKPFYAGEPANIRAKAEYIFPDSFFQPDTPLLSLIPYRSFRFGMILARVANILPQCNRTYTISKYQRCYLACGVFCHRLGADRRLTQQR